MTAARRLAAILAADVVGYSRLMAPTRRARRKYARAAPRGTPIVRSLGARLVNTKDSAEFSPRRAKW